MYRARVSPKRRLARPQAPSSSRDSGGWTAPNPPAPAPLMTSAMDYVDGRSGRARRTQRNAGLSGQRSDYASPPFFRAAQSLQALAQPLMPYSGRPFHPPVSPRLRRSFKAIEAIVRSACADCPHATYVYHPHGPLRRHCSNASSMPMDCGEAISATKRMTTRRACVRTARPRAVEDPTPSPKASTERGAHPRPPGPAALVIALHSVSPRPRCTSQEPRSGTLLGAGASNAPPPPPRRLALAAEPAGCAHRSPI